MSHISNFVHWSSDTLLHHHITIGMLRYLGPSSHILMIIFRYAVLCFVLLSLWFFLGLCLHVPIIKLRYLVLCSLAPMMVSCTTPFAYNFVRYCLLWCPHDCVQKPCAIPISPWMVLRYLVLHSHVPMIVFCCHVLCSHIHKIVLIHCNVSMAVLIKLSLLPCTHDYDITCVVPMSPRFFRYLVLFSHSHDCSEIV